MAKTFFVYQNSVSEKLYKSGLTEREADKAYNELDKLVKNGLGGGVACIGSIEDDWCVAKRLGIV